MPVRRRIAVAVAILAVLVAHGPAALHAQDTAGWPPEVLDVEFRGNTVFSGDQLASAIATRSTSCKLPFPLSVVCVFGAARERFYLNDVQLALDSLRISSLYAVHGYREAEVRKDTISGKDGGVHVVFYVREGRPVRVRTLEVVGGEGILPDGIEARLPLKIGDPFDMNRMEASRDTLLGALHNLGYPRAEVFRNTFTPRGSYEAEVRFEVIPGTPARFGEIAVEGTRNIDPDIVRRILSFKTGDLYRKDALIRSQSNLFGLDVFTHASIQADTDAEPDSIVPVTVRVNEGDLHLFRVGAGVNAADCINAEGRWTSRNFLGGARRLEVRGAISNAAAESLADTFLCAETGTGVYGRLSGSVSADFTQPWFLGSRNSLGLGLIVERRTFPNVYVREAFGGYVALTRAIGSRTNLSLAYRPELTSLAADDELLFCLSYVACTPQQIQTLKDRHWLAPVTLSFLRDRSNSPISPTRGHVMRLETEVAGGLTGSEFGYVRVLGDFSAYHPLPGGVVMAWHLRPGWARTFDGAAAALGLNPQKRFFAGGPNSVRGFAQYRLGPKVLMIDAGRLAPDPTLPWWPGCTAEAITTGECDAGLLAEREPNRFDPRPVGGAALLEGNFEVRFPVLAGRLEGAAFLDFGQVWQEHGDIDLADVVWTPGVGVRYNSPIGPIRVDFGYNTQGAEWLPVLTTTPGEQNRLQPLGQPVSWNPRRSFFDRMQLHFSIGQAF